MSSSAIDGDLDPQEVDAKFAHSTRRRLRRADESPPGLPPFMNPKRQKKKEILVDDDENHAKIRVLSGPNSSSIALSSATTPPPDPPPPTATPQRKKSAAQRHRESLADKISPQKQQELPPSASASAIAHQNHNGKDEEPLHEISNESDDDFELSSRQRKKRAVAPSPKSKRKRKSSVAIKGQLNLREMALKMKKTQQHSTDANSSPSSSQDLKSSLKSITPEEKEEIIEDEEIICEGKDNEYEKMKKNEEERKTKLQERMNRAWHEYYEPKSLNDVVIHPKKLSEILQWLRLSSTQLYQFHRQLNHSKQPQHRSDVHYLPSLLVLNGPSGCCKSSLIRAIAKSWKFTIFNWQEDEQTNEGDESGMVSGFGQAQALQAKLNHFQQFLFQSARYSSLSLSSSSANLSPPAASFSSSVPADVDTIPPSDRKLLVLDSFPTTPSPSLSSLLSLLSSSLPTSRFPLLILLSDEREDSGGAEKVLGNLLSDPRVTQISMNPVPQTVVKKVLNQIALKEKIEAKSEMIDQIAQGCMGDLRNAIQSFQFASLTSSQPSRSSSSFSSASNSKKGSRIAYRKGSAIAAASSSLSFRDENLNLFHALGKILHGKAAHTQSAEENSAGDNSVESIIERSNLSAPLFLDFLQYNAHTFLQTKDSKRDDEKDRDRLEDLFQFYADASKAETISNMIFSNSFGDSISNIQESYATSIASRSFLLIRKHARDREQKKMKYEPIEINDSEFNGMSVSSASSSSSTISRKGSSAPAVSAFALRGSPYSRLMRAAQEVSADIRPSLFYDSSLTHSLGPSSMNFYSLSKSLLFTEFLPLLAIHFNCSLFNPLAFPSPPSASSISSSSSSSASSSRLQRILQTLTDYSHVKKPRVYEVYSMARIVARVDKKNEWEEREEIFREAATVSLRNVGKSKEEKHDEKGEDGSEVVDDIEDFEN